MTQDATDRSETDRLRTEVAEARHHLLTVQDHIVGLEAENGRLHRDLTRVTMELRQQRKRTKNLLKQRDDARTRLQDLRTRLDRNRARVAELEQRRPSVARRVVRRVRGALG